jgi:hypothetical protein
MAKLSELFDPEKPGSVKVRRNCWDLESWFQPYYQRRGYFYGPTNHFTSQVFNDEENDWTIFDEPKTVVYEYMSRYTDEDWYLERRLMTEKEAESFFDGALKYKKTGRSFEI